MFISWLAVFFGGPTPQWSNVSLTTAVKKFFFLNKGTWSTIKVRFCVLFV